MAEVGRADVVSSLEVSDDGVIRVEWGDGHRSEYDAEVPAGKLCLRRVHRGVEPAGSYWTRPRCRRIFAPRTT